MLFFKKNNLFFLVFLTVIFNSCKIELKLRTTEENDEYFPTCSENCTIIKGRLVTDDGNLPLANAEVQLTWDWSSPGWGIVGGRPDINRKKAKTITDENGNFYVSFKMEDNEINSQQYYNLSYFVDENKYLNLLPSAKGKVDGGFLDHLTPKFMHTAKDFLIPKIAFLKVIPQNQNAISNIGEYDFITFFEKNMNGIQKSWQISWKNVPENFILKVPANTPLIFKTIRVKNGITTQEEETVIINERDTYTISKEF